MLILVMLYSSFRHLACACCVHRMQRAMPESEACTLVCGHIPLSKHLSHDTCLGERQAHSVMLTCM